MQLLPHVSALIAGLTIISAGFSYGAGSETKPNVIVVMVDDMGYNDLSCYGSPTMKTPVLNKMAKEGIHFTDFYAGAPVCTPSRIALLSGSYPTRVGWTGGVIGFGLGWGGGLPLEVYSMAEMFKDAGYRTAISGKWHVGSGQLSPMNHGFDSCYYIEASNNQTRKLFRDGKVVNEDFDNKRFTETFTEDVIRFINEKSDKPFFIYVPFTAPHFPAEAHPDWAGESANGAYGDVVEEMDSRMGEIFETLKKHNIDDNTLVVFFSDNGPDRSQGKYAKATPYGGGKWTSREGGTRVPCIIRWPGVIKPGSVSTEIMSAIDLYPTLAEACGIIFKIPEGGQKLDGVSEWKNLIGKSNDHPRKDLLYWGGWGQADAIRVGDYKLFFGSSKGGPNVENGPLLFNLKDDPGESKDIAGDHPDKVNEMLALAKERLQDINNNFIPMPVSDKKNEWRVKDWKPKKQWGQWLND